MRRLGSGRDDDGDYSGLMPRSAMILPQRADSAFMKAAKSSGWLPTGSAPSFASCTFTSGVPTIAMISPASLSVSAPSNGLRTVSVSGIARTSSRAEALQLYSNGYRVVHRLWGDDPSSDDLLWDLSDASNYAADADGLHFSGTLVMRSRYLNEDTCWCDDFDEVYAGIRLINASGATSRSAESSRAVGYF